MRRMREEVFMAGSGGQGILTAGQVLAQTASDVGLQLSWVPVYSPEVRGGLATCTIIISDGRVGSPLTGHPTTMILLDERSVATEIDRTATGGVAIVNSSLARVVSSPPGLRLLELPITEIALRAGSERVANMVALGAYAAARPIVTVEDLGRGLERVLPERHRRFLGPNIEAIRAGAEAAAEALAAG